MIQVRMLDDIRKFEPKFFGPLTKRQTFTVGLAVAVFIPIFIAIPSTIFMKVAISIVFAGPIGMTGWLKFDNLYAEEYLIRVIYRLFLTDKQRKYMTQNELKIELDKKRKIKEKVEQAKYVKTLSKKERKKYQKDYTKSIDYGNAKRYE